MVWMVESNDKWNIEWSWTVTFSKLIPNLKHVMTRLSTMAQYMSGFKGRRKVSWNNMSNYKTAWEFTTICKIVKPVIYPSTFNWFKDMAQDDWTTNMCSFCVSHGWANHRWFSENCFLLKTEDSNRQSSLPNFTKFTKCWVLVNVNLSSDSHQGSAKCISQFSNPKSHRIDRTPGVRERQTTDNDNECVWKNTMIYTNRMIYIILFRLDSRIHEQFESKFGYTP